jgi:PAS domain S-box-containing protein
MRFAHDEAATQDLEVTMVPIVVDGEVNGVFGIAKDITDRVAAEERLLILERSLAASGNGAMIIDVRTEEKQVVYVNPAFTHITGYLEQEAVGHAPLLLSGAETDTADTVQIQAAIQQGISLSTTVRTYRRDGSPFWNQLLLSPVKDANQQVTHFICIINVISDRKEQESQLAYQATHDVLTGLGNRALFSDRLASNWPLAMAKRWPYCSLTWTSSNRSTIRSATTLVISS